MDAIQIEKQFDKVIERLKSTEIDFDSDDFDLDQTLRLSAIFIDVHNHYRGNLEYTVDFMGQELGFTINKKPHIVKPGYFYYIFQKHIDNSPSEEFPGDLYFNTEADYLDFRNKISKVDTYDELAELLQNTEYLDIYDQAVILELVVFDNTINFVQPMNKRYTHIHTALIYYLLNIIKL